MSKFAGIITCRDIQWQYELNRMLSTMALPGSPAEARPICFENMVLGSIANTIISNASKTIHIAMDGKIINAPELEQKLRESSQKVTSSDPGDLLMLAYLTWGKDVFQYINGPYALAIVDQVQKRVLLTRDRLGSKSLFWGKVKGHVLFASNLKGILSSTLVPQAPDLSSIASYFFLGHFAQDKTPIRSINRLLPGYYLEVNENCNILIHKYWAFHHSNNIQDNITQDEVNTKTAELLKSVTDQRLAVNSGISCLLTPDLGSTALAKVLKEGSHDPIKSYSFDFAQTDQIESKYPIRDARHFGFEHQNYTCTPDNIFDNLQHIIWHLDEPVADPYSAGIWQVAKLAKRSSANIFSALGSFELLGSQIGHGEIPYEPLYLWFLYLTKPFLLKGITPLLAKFNKRASLHTLRFFQRDFWALEYIKQQALFSKKSLRKIAPALNGLFDIHLHLQQSYQYLKFILFQNFDIKDYLFFDAETSLSNGLLLQYERLFEAQNLHFSSPFFDYKVMEFLFDVPEALKFKGQQIGTPLYKILEGDFRAEQLRTFKERSPWFLDNWVQHPRIQNIFQKLPYGVLVESKIINGDSLKKVLSKKVWKLHQFERLWAILVLEVWFHLFVNNPILDYPDENQSLEDFLRMQQPFLS